MSESGDLRRDMGGMQDDILRQRADSLAAEQAETADEKREDVLLFSLGEESYGVRIGQVREIYNEYAITPIPCVPDFIVGVINIRGEIVSVTDLSKLMGAGGAAATASEGEQPLVIVVAEGPVCTALMVDAIGAIVQIASGAVEPPLAVADKVQSDYVSGEFYAGGQLVALVSIGRILTPVGGDQAGTKAS